MLCFSAFLFITSFNILVPELTNIIEYYGGSSERGMPIMLFASAALIARPFSGKLVDQIGRKPIIMTGAFICVVLGCLYQFADGLTAFLILRFFHGFSTGFTPVGNTSYLADIAPAHRRGEAMGMLGMFASLGFPAGMIIGSIIAERYDWDTLFYASAGFALVSVLLVSTFKETLPNPKPFSRSMLIVGKDEIWDKALVVPFLVMVAAIFSFATFNIIIFDQALSLGYSVEWKSIFVTIYAVTSILFRYPSGLLSDRIGRRNVAIGGIGFAIAALVILAYCENQTQFIIAGILYGIASGLNSPTLFAWAMDLADKQRVGRAMSTMFIAIEIGVIFGAGIAGVMTGNDNYNFTPVHLLSAGLCAIVFIMLFFVKRDRPPQKEDLSVTEQSSPST